MQYTSVVDAIRREGSTHYEKAPGFKRSKLDRQPPRPSKGAGHERMRFPPGRELVRSITRVHYFPNYPVSLAASVVSMNANRRSSEREPRF